MLTDLVAQAGDLPCRYTQGDAFALVFASDMPRLQRCLWKFLNSLTRPEQARQFRQSAQILRRACPEVRLGHKRRWCLVV